MRSKILKQFGLVLGPLLFTFTLLFFKPEGLSPEGVAVLATTLWVAIWWILEVVPIAVTAMLPIILFPITGAMELSTTTAAFGHKYVFLYIGGFILAIAIEKWNLHKRIALTVINIIGTSVSKIILGFMIATAFLSMWISNTATTVMMLPIGMAIILQLKDNPKTKEDENEIFGKALMLSIAYSASIGGVATLIGTPPNLIFAGILEEQYNVEMTFSKWIIYGLPISIILLFICWKYMTTVAFSFTQKDFPGGKAEIKRLLKNLGKISYEEKTVLIVFCITAFLWMTRSFLISKLIPAIDDTIIAMASATILFILPTKKRKEKKIINWESAVKLPWGILLLFGGGLALAEGFKTSGLAEWIGSQVTQFENLPLFALLFVLILAVNFLTEITSNLATTAMLLPVIAPIALILDVHPFTLMVGITVAASCAFMLPVATPPNAIVFGSGYLKIPDMMRTGILMNVISVILITLITYYLLPLLWDFDPNVFPEALKQTNN
ncbi:DASS family sodium-coupled anion symporter [Flavobacteriaceae bacterium S0825]|uniref:SLC13 family permease n=1 Tax=Gaetbulibacter sp. S0825 TaxID=2720084 RepID=UPI00142FFFB5|nr:DASS family sodium-coupled anion symporter [Gaetbulibacter sp. S0825]MCK0108897.1 DASS family sodium-coupled anion symporter [Flavobacteriaceae bacterium S0825]NIX64533.1 DASS family sodium-coupled anion symporter [Gaetbulibacter sp. S0825]